MTRLAAVLVTAIGFAFVTVAVAALAGAWWALGFVGCVLVTLGLLVDERDSSSEGVE